MGGGGGAGVWHAGGSVSHLDREDLIPKELEDKTRLLKLNILASLQTETAAGNRQRSETSGTFSLQQQCHYHFVQFIFKNLNQKKTHFPCWLNCTKTFFSELQFEQQQELNFRIHSHQQEKLTSSFFLNTSKNAKSESINLKSSTLLSYVSLPNLWKSLKLSPDIHKVTSSRGDAEARPSCHSFIATKK